MNLFPLPINGSLPIFAVSNDTTVVDDACNPLPASTPDLSGFLVIIRRGTCNFVRVITLDNLYRPDLSISDSEVEEHRRQRCQGISDLQVRQAGLGILRSYVPNVRPLSNVNGLSSITTGNFTTALIQATDGQFLVSQFAAGKPITVAFPQTGRSFGLPQPTGGLVSTFTSFGPTYDFFLYAQYHLRQT